MTAGVERRRPPPRPRRNGGSRGCRPVTTRPRSTRGSQHVAQRGRQRTAAARRIQVAAGFVLTCSSTQKMCSSSSNLCSSDYTFVQLQSTATRCYATDHAGGTNSAPPNLLAGFWGEEGGGERERGRKGEWDKRKGGGRNRERKEKNGRERGEFCAVVIFVDTLLWAAAGSMFSTCIGGCACVITTWFSAIGVKTANSPRPDMNIMDCCLRKRGSLQTV